MDEYFGVNPEIARKALSNLGISELEIADFQDWEWLAAGYCKLDENEIASAHQESDKEVRRAVTAVLLEAAKLKWREKSKKALLDNFITFFGSFPENRLDFTQYWHRFCDPNDNFADLKALLFGSD